LLIGILVLAVGFPFGLAGLFFGLLCWAPAAAAAAIDLALMPIDYG
jgi:hypothetical protein